VTARVLNLCAKAWLAALSIAAPSPLRRLLVGGWVLSAICCRVHGASVSICSEPANLVALPGEEVGLYFYCFESPAPSYQWFHNGEPIAGATDTLVIIPAASTNDAGSYFRTADYGGGNVATNPVITVFINWGPAQVAITPLSETVYAGIQAWFQALAIGIPEPTVQWFFNGQPIPSATNVDLRFTASTSQQGDYSVVVSNSINVVTSQVASLIVLTAPPEFSAQPLTQGAVAGESVAFSAAASGQPPPAYQWFFNGSPLPGETSASLSIARVFANRAGSYFVVATNEVGSVTSEVARLAVTLVGGLDRFEWRQPLPQGNDLYAAASGNGKLVVVGRKGAKGVSSDAGMTWHYAQHDASSAYGVAFGAGLFVAVGGNRGRANEGLPLTLQTSPDGLHWTDRLVTTTNLSTSTDVA
jgi:hypothetical protein